MAKTKDADRATAADQAATFLRTTLHQHRLSHADLVNALGVGKDAVNSWTAHVDPAIPSQRFLPRLCTWLEQLVPGSGTTYANHANYAWKSDDYLAPLICPQDQFFGRTPDLGKIRDILT